MELNEVARFEIERTGLLAAVEAARMAGVTYASEHECGFCRKPIEYVLRFDGRRYWRHRSHKCDPKRINHIEGTRAAVEDRMPRTPSFAERLNDGFTMLRACRH